MKYYVNEKIYNSKGVLLSSERITGDIEDISWARKQMETRFQTKLIENRHSIKPGAIACSMTKCSMELKNGRYVVSIEEIPEQRSMTASEILLALSNKYEGDFDVIYKYLSEKKVACDPTWVTKNKYSKAVTLLDNKYPSYLKQIIKPAMVIYYQGRLELLSDSYENRICISTNRYTSTQYLHRIDIDLMNLPKSVVIVTSMKAIAEIAIARKHPVILVLACGVNQTTPQIDEEIKQLVLENNGLIITPYPDNKVADPTTFLVKNRLMMGVSTCLLIGETSQHSSNMQLLAEALTLGKDVMVYPTIPNIDLANNQLIQEGAYLVENAEDIKNILK